MSRGWCSRGAADLRSTEPKVRGSNPLGRALNPLVTGVFSKEYWDGAQSSPWSRPYARRARDHTVLVIGDEVDDHVTAGDAAIPKRGLAAQKALA